MRIRKKTREAGGSAPLSDCVAVSGVFVVADERPEDDRHAEGNKDVHSGETQEQCSLDHRDAPPFV